MKTRSSLMSCVVLVIGCSGGVDHSGASSAGSFEEGLVATAARPAPSTHGVLFARAADVVHDGKQCAGVPMTPHGGPVMHNAQIHPIYWHPNGNASWTALVGQTQNQISWLVEEFVTDLSAFPMFQTLKEYPDSSGAYPTSVTFSNSYSEYDGALPHRGTMSDPVQQSDIESAIDSFVSGAKLPGSTDDLYVLFMPTSVHFCDRQGHCTFPPAGGTSSVGGWHTVTPGGRVYAVIGSDDTLRSGAFAPVVTPWPNGEAIDTMYNTLSHEIFEALTDPRMDGWFGPDSDDESCFENGDRCNGTALSFTVKGSSTLFPKSFDIQQEWSNATMGCGLLNPHITSVFPTHGPLTGVGVTIVGTNFTKGMTIPGVNGLDCFPSVCTGTMEPDATPGPVTLWSHISLASDPNVSDILDANPNVTFTYDPPAPPPSCSATLACPPSYGPQLMTIACTTTVDFFKVDTYDGSISTYSDPGTNTQTAMELYQYDLIEACAPGTTPAQFGVKCATFSTYESSAGWCGPSGGGGGTCPKGTHYCGPDEGCAKICT